MTYLPAGFIDLKINAEELMNTALVSKLPQTILRAHTDVAIITLDTIADWKKWIGQRPVTINEKVRGAAEELKATQTVHGIISIGIIDKGRDRGTYLLDGQHRIEGFKLCGLPEVIAEVRTCHFNNMAEMGAEFVRLNSRLVAWKPDDHLRGLEGSMPTLQTIRKSCEFVGYDSIRRGTGGPILSMSMLLRCWAASGSDTPSFGGGGKSAADLAHDLSSETAQQIVVFLQVASSAWGRDPEYHRLWGALNLTIVMWLWRRLVLDTERGVKRYVILKPEMFRKAMMSLSADGNYIDWLLGRKLSDRDRAPCYARIKSIFVRRLKQEFGGKPIMLPQPPWGPTSVKL